MVNVSYAEKRVRRVLAGEEWEKECRERGGRCGGVPDFFMRPLLQLFFDLQHEKS